MSSGRFPGPYVADVPAEGGDKMMVTVPFANMGIGARKSGTPSDPSTGPKPIEHVGGTTGGGKK